jgi:hypothetical protein
VKIVKGSGQTKSGLAAVSWPGAARIFFSNEDKILELSSDNSTGVVGANWTITDVGLAAYTTQNCHTSEPTIQTGAAEASKSSGRSKDPAASESATPTLSLTAVSETTISLSGSQSQPWTTYPTVPSYNGSGELLTGHCGISLYTLVHQQAAYDLWIPVLGCAGDRLDCCPFTASSDPSSSPQPIQPPALVGGGFPSAAPTSRGAGGASEQVTLSSCPADYYRTSTLCCPRQVLLHVFLLHTPNPEQKLT